MAKLASTVVSEARCLPKYSCLDPAGRINREQVSGGEINRQDKQNARQRGQGHAEGWRPVEQTRPQPHQQDFHGEDGCVRQIFSQHDLPEAHR